jgi:hypothetical protein
LDTLANSMRAGDYPQRCWQGIKTRHRRSGVGGSGTLPAIWSPRSIARIPSIDHQLSFPNHKGQPLHTPKVHWVFQGDIAGKGIGKSNGLFHRQGHCA